MPVTLRWLGQAGFIVAGAGTTILLDPYFAPRPDRLREPPVRPEDLDDVDAVLATHEHRDHLDLVSLPRLLAASPGARVIVPAPVREAAARALPPERVVGARVGETLHAGRARVTPLPALHGVSMADAYTFGLDASGAHRFLGYVVELDGVRLYHAGDTIRYDGLVEALRLLRPDVALLPINGRDAAREARGVVGNLDHLEAAALAAAVGIPVLVPMHFGTIAGNTADPELLVEHARAAHPDLEVVVPGDDEIVLPIRRTPAGPP